MDDILKQLQEKYDLQRRLACMDAERAELAEALKLAVYEKREQETLLREYQGSFRSFLHGLSGKRVQEQERLTQEAKAARDRLDGVNWKIADLERKITAANEDLALLADVSEAMVPPEQAAAFAAIKADHLLKTTAPLLRQCREALEQSLAVMRSDIHFESQKRSIYVYQGIANDLAQEICGRLEELNGCLASCGIAPVEPTPYLRNPAGYLVTAFQFGELDQGNRAIAQLSGVGKALAGLKKPLADVLGNV